MASWKVFPLFYGQTPSIELLWEDVFMWLGLYPVLCRLPKQFFSLCCFLSMINLLTTFMFFLCLISDTPPLFVASALNKVSPSNPSTLWCLGLMVFLVWRQKVPVWAPEDGQCKKYPIDTEFPSVWRAIYWLSLNYFSTLDYDGHSCSIYLQRLSHGFLSVNSRYIVRMESLVFTSCRVHSC